MPDPSFSLTTLGELRLDGPTGPLLPGRRKELVLLACLARRASKPVSREELSALLWGDRDEDKARQSLRQALHQLRQALGPAIEVTTDHARIADGAIAFDVRLLELDIAATRYQDAIGRWNGEFLPGAEDAGDESFRAWLEREREAVRYSVIDGLSHLVEAARLEGRIEQEIHWASEWAEHFPLDEGAYLRLIDAVRRQGDVERARRLHAGFVARLKSELDASPSVELIRLGESLTRASQRDTQRHRGSGAVHAPALVGRGAIIASSLIETWTRIRAEGCTAVIEGDAGLGKTRLCSELMRRARGDTPQPLILTTHAEDHDALAEYSTLRRLMSVLVTAPGLGDTPAKTLAELSEVFPTLRERFPQLGSPSGRPDRIETAFRDLLRVTASRASLLVILDDAGKSDPASLRLLNAVVAENPPGLLTIFTLCPDHSTEAAIGLRLGEHPAVKRFKLAPLDRDSVGELVDSMIEVAPSSREQLVAGLCAETDGSPQRVIAQVSAMTTSGALTLNDGGIWQLNAGQIPAHVAGQASTVPRGTERALGSNSTRRQWWVPAVALTLVLAAIPVGRQMLFDAPVTTAVASPRVAVLDLELVSRDTLDSFLASGLAEEINASLSRLPGLRLKSRGVVRTAQAKGVRDAVQLGRDLQVDYLVEGAIRRVGQALKVSVTLTKAADGFQVWNEDFSTDEGLPVLHDRIAQEVATRVGTQLGEQATASARSLTTDVRAYEYFLRGNYYLARRTPPTVQQAIAHYRTAVARDTAFAAAWARLSYAHSLLLDWGWAHDGRSSDELLQEGLAFAARAIELDSLSADAWMAKAYLLESSDPVRMNGAAEAFERAIQLDPRNTEAIHQYAQVHEALGNWDAAIAAFRRTLLLEPDRSLPYVSMASIAWKQGQPTLARRLYDSALVVDPGASYVLSARALLRLFSLNDATGGLEDAETAVRVNDGYAIPPHAVLAIALARTGSKARAELEVERALTEIVDPSSPSPTDARFIASALLAIGRREDALALLERARPRGAWLWFYFLSADFDPVRSDPRFVRVMADAHPRAAASGSR